MTQFALVIAVVAGALSCFFAAVNHALHVFSSSKLDDKLPIGSRDYWGQLLTDQRGSILLLTAVLRTLLNMAILAALVAVFDDTFRDLWMDLLAALIVAGVFVAVVGIAVPISWAGYAPESLLATSLPLLRVFVIFFHPVLWLLHMFDPLVHRLVGVTDDDDELNPVAKELIDVASEGEKTGMVDENQKEMIEAVVEFPLTTVGEIMTPRTDVRGISLGASLDEVTRFIYEAGHSRVPVYDGDLDHILGVLYAKDLLKLVGSNGDVPFDLRSIARDAQFVPESKTIRDLLTDFQVSKIHMAVVLDEYGGTAGLVTIEDILEELVGEIHDEYEPQATQEPQITRVDARVAEAEGRVHIDDLNDELEIDLPEDEDYDTVGGFVFATLGHVPEAGETFEFEDVRVVVLEAERTRVNRVRIEILTAKQKAQITDAPANGNRA